MNWKKTSREIPCKECGGEGVIWQNVYDQAHGVSVPVDEDCPKCGGTGSQGIKKRPDDAYAK